MYSIKFKVEFPDSTELDYKSSSNINYVQSQPIYQSVTKTRHPLYNLKEATSSTEDHLSWALQMSCTTHKGRDRTTQNHSHGDVLLQNKERYYNLGLFPKIMIVPDSVEPKEIRENKSFVKVSLGDFYNFVPMKYI